MDVHPFAHVWVCASSLMSDREGQRYAIFKHAVTQALIMIHGLMQSMLILQ